VRIGVFQIGQACRGIDLTKDSKYLIAAATTDGIHIYEVSTGKKLSTIQVPGVNTKMVALNYGDNQVLCLYDYEKRSYIRIYNIEDCLASNTPNHVLEIAATGDNLYTGIVWGAKNESIIISTNNGKLILYDLVQK
jgi:WD40 repeat protein